MRVSGSYSSSHQIWNADGNPVISVKRASHPKTNVKGLPKSRKEAGAEKGSDMANQGGGAISPLECFIARGILGPGDTFLVTRIVDHKRSALGG